MSLSLYGGFLHNAQLSESDISLKKADIFAGLLIGAMLPYLFSAFTIRSVGKAAFGMVEEVRRQIRENPGILEGTVEPDYKACIRISTRASLIEMIAPGALVIYISNSGHSEPSHSRFRIRPINPSWFPSRSYRQWCPDGCFSCQYRRCLGQC